MPRLAAAALVLALLGTVSVAPAQVVRGDIAGRLVDRATHRAVTGAEVSVLGHLRSVRSDSTGAFAHRGLAPGTYLLQVRKIGYVKSEWPVTVPEGKVVELLLQLDPVGFVLPPAVVEGRPEDLPTWYRGFEERRRTQSGQYVTRAEIEHEDPTATLGDLLRHVHGLELQCNRGGCAIRMTRWQSCQPYYYQDGLPVYATTAERFLAFDIYGVEVYDLSEVPLEFQRPGLRCGVIAIWTRRGPPPRK